MLPVSWAKDAGASTSRGIWRSMYQANPRRASSATRKISHEDVAAVKRIRFMTSIMPKKKRELVGHAVGGEERAGRFAFSGGLQAEHQSAPGRIAAHKIIRFRLPIGVRKADHGLPIIIFQLKDDPRAVPLLAAGTAPFCCVRLQYPCQ